MSKSSKKYNSQGTGSAIVKYGGYSLADVISEKFGSVSIEIEDIPSMCTTTPQPSIHYPNTCNMNKIILPKSYYPMDDLACFDVFGFDVKITPTHFPKIIEINGINSGCTGFATSGTKLSLHEPSLSSSVKEYAQNKSNPISAAIERSIGELGEIPAGVIGKRLRDDFGKHYYFRSLIPIIEYATFYGPKKDYSPLVDAILQCEGILDDKLHVARVFDNSCKYKACTFLYDEANVQLLSQIYDPEYVVVKPRYGLQGKDVVIAPLDEISKKIAFSRKFVIEPFIPSKAIFSSKTHKEHDGCMRYIVMVEESKDQEKPLTIRHFGGYWRLCPQPLENGASVDSLRANLSQGALAQAASVEDVSCVRNMIDEVLPTFYTSLRKFSG